MPEIPRDGSLDSTLALKLDPYGFISKRCRRLGSDLFRTRLLLQETICLMGKEAAELVYDESRFIRATAPPGRVQKTLFGKGGVRSLDDEAHRRRKHMFMSLMTPEQIRNLAERSGRFWEERARTWKQKNKIVLYDEARSVLCQSVCGWAGAHIPEDQLEKRTRDLTALFDSAGSVGPRHWWGRLKRKKTEHWIGALIEEIRSGHRSVPLDSPAHVIAHYRDVDGNLLPTRTAAVELLNILRPTVAVSVYITFAAHALYTNPHCRQHLQNGDIAYPEIFVQEVRRFYPFFPSIMARVRDDFTWRGYEFLKNTRVMLDLYGTDHDERLWRNPDHFNPARFDQRQAGAFDFIPQGGGDPNVGHRCPGERITVELTKVAAAFLACRMTYTVPEQDLEIEWTRIPALPRSHFVLTNAHLNDGQ